MAGNGSTIPGTAAAEALETKGKGKAKVAAEQPVDVPMEEDEDVEDEEDEEAEDVSFPCLPLLATNW
jgi:hypothetical protein